MYIVTHTHTHTHTFVANLKQSLYHRALTSKLTRKFANFSDRHSVVRPVIVLNLGFGHALRHLTLYLISVRQNLAGKIMQ
jgi:hypothetical protein